MPKTWNSIKISHTWRVISGRKWLELYQKFQTLCLSHDLTILQTSSWDLEIYSFTTQVIKKLSTAYESSQRKWIEARRWRAILTGGRQRDQECWQPCGSCFVVCRGYTSHRNPLSCYPTQPNTLQIIIIETNTAKNTSKITKYNRKHDQIECPVPYKQPSIHQQVLGGLACVRLSPQTRCWTSSRHINACR